MALFTNDAHDNTFKSAISYKSVQLGDKYTAVAEISNCDFTYYLSLCDCTDSKLKCPSDANVHDAPRAAIRASKPVFEQLERAMFDGEHDGLRFGCIMLNKSHVSAMLWTDDLKLVPVVLRPVFTIAAYSCPKEALAHASEIMDILSHGRINWATMSGPK